MNEGERHGALSTVRGFAINPGEIRGNLVSCTGAQFCGLAMVETKNNAERIADELEEIVEVPADVRIHWTGCPNSCGQVQAGDIGSVSYTHLTLPTKA